MPVTGDVPQEPIAPDTPAMAEATAVATPNLHKGTLLRAPGHVWASWVRNLLTAFCNIFSPTSFATCAFVSLLHYFYSSNFLFAVVVLVVLHVSTNMLPQDPLFHVAFCQSFFCRVSRLSISSLYEAS